MVVWRWWSGRTGVERLDLSTRWPLYVTSASEPLIAVLLLRASPHPAVPTAAVLLAAAVVHAVVCVLLLRAGISHLSGGPRPAPRLIAAAALVTAAGLGVAVILPPPTAGAAVGFPVRLAVAILFCGALTAALTPVLRPRQVLAVVGVPAAVAAAVQALTDKAPGHSSWAVSYLLFVGAVAYTYRLSVWYLAIVWELDRSRDVQARLAVAEERLRFARDLHDVLGRNLTLIAVNSELAAGLQRRGEAGAPELMLAVRQTAQDSMREVRDVASGYRSTDLDAELAGARSLLRSAGIVVRLIGEGAELPRSAQAALGWVVREATTNIIRHADPTTVVIELSDEAGAVAVLRIDNDGARPVAAGDRGHHGTGLTGLSERLAALGGDVIAQALPGGRFNVQARIPLTRSAPVPLPAAPAP